MDTLNIVGFAVTVSSLAYAIYTNAKLSYAMKNGPIQSTRTVIDRLEEEKKNFENDSPAYKTMHHTQQGLEDIAKTLKSLLKFC